MWCGILTLRNLHVISTSINKVGIFRIEWFLRLKMGYFKYHASFETIHLAIPLYFCCWLQGLWSLASAYFLFVFKVEQLFELRVSFRICSYLAIRRAPIRSIFHTQLSLNLAVL
jgi:hypothetical protein